MRAQLALRRGTEADAKALAEFAAQAFWDTYRELDDPNDVRSYIEEHFTQQALCGVLRESNCYTLLAVAGGQLAGCAILRSCEPPACVQGPSPIELARLYVGHDYIGHGVGARLMLAVHSEACRLGAKTLWLGVYDRNARAIKFYESFGFRKVGGKELLFGGRICIDPIYAVAVRDDAKPFARADSHRRGWSVPILRPSGYDRPAVVMG